MPFLQSLWRQRRAREQEGEEGVFRAAAAESVRRLDQVQGDQPGRVPHAAAQGSAREEAAGRTFNRNTLGLSFGLKSGLRFLLSKPLIFELLPSVQSRESYMSQD